MSALSRRGNVVAVLVALAAGVAAAWIVNGYVAELERKHGSPVSVLIASRPLRRGTLLDQATLAASVGVRRVPRSFVPQGAFVAPEELAGMRTSVDLPAGSWLVPALFQPPDGDGEFKLRRGERAVSVAGSISPDGAEPRPGRLVDVIAAGARAETTAELVLAGAELLAADGGRVTLRATLAQAVALVRAETSAKELRVLMRP